MILDINKRRKMITIRNLATQQIHVIHRITFSADVSSRKRNTINFVLERRQFPFRLCFAMTIDKPKGQSLRRVGLDLREQVFSHGQLYVAFGRVLFKEDILTLVTDQARSISEPGTFCLYSAGLLISAFILFVVCRIEMGPNWTITEFS
jgi:hypothetical protein